MIILLHAQLIAETGGSEGVRDEGLFEIALLFAYKDKFVQSTNFKLRS